MLQGRLVSKLLIDYCLPSPPPPCGVCWGTQRESAVLCRLTPETNTVMEYPMLSCGMRRTGIGELHPKISVKISV